MSGGVNLDETALLSTTSISDAADSASVVYSTNAISNSPFRVVGYIMITEATAGTWATAPTLVQGCGGQALAALQSIGYGQTWQILTGSRALGTTYYNTTGRPIVVAVNINTAVSASLTVNGDVIMSAPTNATLAVIVPPGGSYSASSASSIARWAELR